MSAEQERTIATQQKTIQGLERELSRIRNLVLGAEVCSISSLNNQLSSVLDSRQPVAVSRYRLAEAVIIPISQITGQPASYTPKIASQLKHCHECLGRIEKGERYLEVANGLDGLIVAEHTNCVRQS